MDFMPVILLILNVQTAEQVEGQLYPKLYFGILINSPFIKKTIDREWTKCTDSSAISLQFYFISESVKNLMK
jgi:hypothetical protein